MRRSKRHLARRVPSEAATYQIRVLGPLDEKWSDWFEGLTIASETDDAGSPITTLTGLVADQAALRGVLARLWDLNLTLISVRRIEASGEEEDEKRCLKTRTT